MRRIFLLCVFMPFASRSVLWKGVAAVLFLAGIVVSTTENAAQASTCTWTSSAATASLSWREVVYGNGRWVAVASSGALNRVMTSEDGITWTERTAADDLQWQSVTYGNGLFVAVAQDAGGSASDRVMTSPDGITWTLRTAAAANTWTSVTFGNGLFVAVSTGGTDRVMTSPDGITWTARPTTITSTWGSVTYGNGLFVAVADFGGNVMTSPDGITWTARTGAASDPWMSVTHGNGLFVAVAQTGAGQVMTSPDGITWTERTAAADTRWQSVSYGNGLFVAVGRFGLESERVMTSPDGITWRLETPASDGYWEAVAFGSGLFVAVGFSLAGAGLEVMTSGCSVPLVPVTFDGNGGSGSMSAQTSSSATNLIANAFTRAGYTFAGWNTAANGSGTPYANSASYPFTANATLYAQWSGNTLTVVTEEDGSSGVADASTTTGALMDSPGTPSRAGYVFAGWSMTPAGATVSFPYAHGQTSNFTLYAQWSGNLPATGGMWGVTVVWAFMLLVAGVGLFGARRRVMYSLGGR